MKLYDELKKVPSPRELAFPEAEYMERLRKVRQRMAAAGLDVLLITNTPNLGYLTGYETHMGSSYSVGIVPLEGEVAIHLPEVEVTGVHLNSWVKDAIPFIWYEAEDTATQLGQVLKERGFHNKTIGIEMGHADVWASTGMDVRSYLRLVELLPGAKFKDATELVLEVRMVKSPAELEYMRKAGEITFKGLRAAIAEVAPGKTDNDLVATGCEAMHRAGSELMSIEPMIMTGYRTGWMPHVMWKRNPLKVGDPIYMEFTATYRRYNAPSMRSVSVGPPTETVKRLTEASITTLKLLIENIRPGRTGHEVALEAKKGLAPVAEEAYFHGAFGYAIGMGFTPTWTEGSTYIAEGAHRPLEPGMTFHLPICIWVPGKCGIGFSESVAVSPTGCEVLTPMKDLELAVSPV